MSRRSQALEIGAEHAAYLRRCSSRTANEIAADWGFSGSHKYGWADLARIFAREWLAATEPQAAAA